MAKFRRELPSEGLARVEVELWRGNINVRSARPGELGSLESDWEAAVATEGKTLRIGQPINSKRPLGPADLIGEQQVRIEIEGKVLFDKQILRGGGGVELVLPSSVREISFRTARGDICLEGIEAVVDAYTGRGNVQLSGGRDRLDRAKSLELEVLESLSRGDLSVDEALLLLEKIKKEDEAARGEAL